MNNYQRFADNLFRDENEDFLLRSAADLPTLPRMTVCIGILCMNGTVAVMAADRQVTHRSLKYATVSPDCKIAQLTHRRLLATAGEPPRTVLLEECRRNCLAEQSAEEVAKAISKVCARLWRERMSQTTTEWKLGMDFETFIEKSGGLDKKIVDDVWRQINQTSGGGIYLLAALDSSGAHLYAIAEREGSSSLDSPGFAAIGDGADLAMSILYRKPLVRSWAIADAIYLAYEAKRMAENCPTVGRETDLAVMLPGRDTYFLTEEAVSRLETIYKSKEPPSLSKVEADTIQALLPPT